VVQHTDTANSPTCGGCTPQYSQGCYQNPTNSLWEKWWYNSCGNRDTIIGSCAAGQPCNVVNGVATCQPGCINPYFCAASLPPGASLFLQYYCTSGNCYGCNAGTPTQCGLSCVNTNTDTSNCGSCGGSCSGANMNPSTCTSGSCTGTCNTNYLNCNNNLRSDGCEVDKRMDASNCGSCGHVCPSGTPICSGGVCISNQCTPGTPPQSCYTGPSGTQNVGICHAAAHKRVVATGHGARAPAR
jgi:hypothetical protein